MRYLHSFFLVSFLLMNLAPAPYVVSASLAHVKPSAIQLRENIPNILYAQPRTSTTQASSSAPVILYAQWIGKSLDVQGRNFAEGAIILIDGQKVKTANVDNALSFELFAKKAKKRIPPDQAITLQVQNPNGETSGAFAFYSGFVITMTDQGDLIHMSIGDKFLLFLPPAGDPPTVVWILSIMGATIGSDPTILARTTEDLPIPHAQGFFQGIRPGQVIVHAEASPLCPPLPRWQCEQSGANFGRFDLGVVVE